MQSRVQAQIMAAMLLTDYTVLCDEATACGIAAHSLQPLHVPNNRITKAHVESNSGGKVGLSFCAVAQLQARQRSRPLHLSVLVSRQSLLL